MPKRHDLSDSTGLQNMLQTISVSDLLTTKFLLKPPQTVKLTKLRFKLLGGKFSDLINCSTWEHVIGKLFQCSTILLHLYKEYISAVKFKTTDVV